MVSGRRLAPEPNMKLFRIQQPTESGQRGRAGVVILVFFLLLTVWLIYTAQKMFSSDEAEIAEIGRSILPIEIPVDMKGSRGVSLHGTRMAWFEPVDGADHGRQLALMATPKDKAQEAAEASKGRWFDDMAEIVDPGGTFSARLQGKEVPGRWRKFRKTDGAVFSEFRVEIDRGEEQLLLILAGPENSTEQADLQAFLDTVPESY
ncbi:MAG: hypothetical protein DWQ01_00290 [Planctomycetota bacterium]|nr:MAG: hypothetical protein DWQ01_00290 [Planctomycetota bacterium]